MTRPASWPVLALLLLAAACGDGSEAGATDDDRLPPVELLALEDEASFGLDDATDAPRVINLWATWCAPCRSELPAFDTVATAAGSDIAMLGVNVGEDADTAATLIAELGVEFAQSVNPAGDVTAELGVAGLPATVFATADGEILAIHGGALDAAQLADRIAELFGVNVDV